MLLSLIVQFRKAKGAPGQRAHLKSPAFTLIFDLNENDTKFRYVSANLPWTAFARYVLFIGSRKGD